MSNNNPEKDNFHNLTLGIDILSICDNLISKGTGQSNK